MWFDLVIFALLVVCTVRGAAKGFAWQIATIGALVLCFFFAQTGSLAIAPLIKLDPPLNRWVAMFVLYLIASFVSFGAARAVRKTLEKWQFVEYDRHLGAVFGFVKGVAFGLVITFFAVTLSDAARASVLTSYSGHAAGGILSALHPVLPDELHAVIDPYMEKLGREVVHDDGFGKAPADFGGGSGHGEFGIDPSGSRLPSDVLLGGGAGRDEATKPQPPAGDFGPGPGAESGFDPGRAVDGRPSGYGAEVDRLLATIPDEWKQSAIRAVKESAAEDRDEILAKFKETFSGFGTPPRGTAEGQSASTRIDGTLAKIATRYTADSLDRENIIREAQARLGGLPENVAEAVVRDWHADLDQGAGPDPDPATNLSTRLDVRIDRQLRAFGARVGGRDENSRSKPAASRR